MKKDQNLSMKYANNDRLHSAIDDMSAAAYEQKYLQSRHLVAKKILTFMSLRFIHQMAINCVHIYGPKQLSSFAPS